MRIINKQRKVGGVKQAQHLVWTSDTHKRDQRAADDLRTSIRVESPITFREPIKDAAEISCQVLFSKVKENDEVKMKARYADEEEYVREVSRQARKRNWYISSKRKRKTNGIIDTYVGLPPWWTKVLTEEMENGTMTAEQVKKIVVKIGARSMEALRKRTGYDPLYLAVHPESINNLHIHFGVCNINEENELIGRSANGSVGKKGLRHAGDCNLALMRMNQLVPHPFTRKGAVKALTGDCDDVAIAKVIDSTLEELLPDRKERARELGISHAKEWIKRATEKATVDPNALRKENRGLKAENERLKAELIAMREERLARYIGEEVRI